MARVEFDTGLVEAAVFAEVRAREAAGEARTGRRFHEELNVTYAQTVGEKRDAAARKVHAVWFAELGLDKPIRKALDESRFPVGRVERVFTHSVGAPNEEGAELHGRRDTPGGPETLSVVIRLRTARFQSREFLAAFLRHELTLLGDLLDPSFADARLAQFPAGPARERYRMLWEANADGRLAQRKLEGVRNRDEWNALFERGFGFLKPDTRNAVFEKLWSGGRWSHADLFAAASDPRATLGGDRGARVPGAPCPLCRFPTHVWLADGDLAADVSLVALIRTRFPKWSAADGACRECCDRYSLLNVNS